MEEMKILICSQNEAFCRRVEDNLALWQEAFCICCETERLGRDALPEQEGAICFLDLTDAASYIYTPRDAATVVAASNDAQAIASYRYHPAAFLRVDFSYAEFCEAMGRCHPLWRSYLRRLELTFHREPVRLPLCQLNYAEADGRETVLNCAGAVMRASTSLGKLGETLPSPPFLRCQKSFLVNITAIREISAGKVVMADGRGIPMARARAQELTEAVRAWNAARGTEVSVT
ncbi:MAG: LytTR family transcriptional regulator DNA-binding domain-containing protein [Oscillospiraceae bacterium]|nr:LytTR family transcriptional regulator DNA-binding domain-containing protein [Oscillospiraceae bacterium]